MSAPTLLTLPFTLRARRPVHWPHFAGSALRGTLGITLRQLTCATGQSHCQGCPLRARCGYGVVFDPTPPASPLHPSFNNGLPAYLFEPPALGARELRAGDTVQAALHLLPPAHPHLGLVQSALSRAAERLLQPASFDLHAHPSETHTLSPLPPLPPPASQDIPCAPPAAGTPQSQPALPGPASPVSTVTLHWLTPLRLQQSGRPVSDPRQLTARHLVRAWHRRHLQWCQLSAQPPSDAQPYFQAGDACQIHPIRLVWHELERQSNRQQRKVPLSGLLGSVQLSGPPAAIANLHALATHVQPLGIGKETVFGLGRYRVGQLSA